MTLVPPNGRDLSPDQLWALKMEQRRKGYDKTATQQQAENEAAVNSLYAGLGGNSAPSGSTFDKTDTAMRENSNPDPRMNDLARQVDALYGPSQNRRENPDEMATNRFYWDVSKTGEPDEAEKDSVLPDEQYEPLTPEDEGDHVLNGRRTSARKVYNQLDASTADRLAGEGDSRLAALDVIDGLGDSIHANQKGKFDKQTHKTETEVQKQFEKLGIDEHLNTHGDRLKQSIETRVTTEVLEAGVGDTGEYVMGKDQVNTGAHGDILNTDKAHEAVRAVAAEEFLLCIKNGDIAYDALAAADPSLARFVSGYGSFFSDRNIESETNENLAELGRRLEQSEPAMQLMQQMREQKLDAAPSPENPQNHSNVFETSSHRSFTKKPAHTPNTPLQKNTKTTNTLLGSEQRVSWR
ncbi:MAG: hypothetical protein Q4B27_00790 [Candidatus Saccharibacteria bacterium]|nr:hypothetical protein [Candidatus Saccharibacteria bacterium]